MAEREDIVKAARALPGASGFLGLPVDADWVLVREYDATSADGRPVKVFVRRMPAQFWRLTSGDIEITSGSGDEVGRLIDAVARAIAEGMIGFGLPGRRP